MPKELVEAPRAVLQLVLDGAVQPRLEEVERDLQTPLALSVAQGVAPRNIVASLVTRNPPPGVAVRGTAQVNFRMNYGGDRYLFRAEVVFPRELSPDTGFSGFNVPGAVEVVDTGYQLDTRNWTVQYNVWEFAGYV